MRSSQYAQHLKNLSPHHVVAASGFVALLVTVLSVSELQGIISKADQTEHTTFLPKHTDWQTLSAVAHKAVEHVEHFPQFGHRGQPLHPIAGSTGGSSSSGSSSDSSSSDSSSGSGSSSSSSESTSTSDTTDTSDSSSSSSKSLSVGSKEDLSKLKKECNAQQHTEYWGDVVKWGSSNIKESAAECCEDCLNHKPTKEGGDKCNVWVYCGNLDLCGGQYKECWLKHLVHPGAAKPAAEGPKVGWTAGLCGEVDNVADVDPEDVSVARKFHVVTSAQGSAVHWQTRVHYYWYKKRKAECLEKLKDRCEMGGFTRLLHSGQADDLMDEVPTFLADPLPDSVVEHSWYPVLNRPYAFMQWVEKANIKEKYVLMSEPDHIMLRPLPNFMRHDHPAAFPFFYIEPTKEEYLPLVAKHLGVPSITKQEAAAIAPIGNSPTFLTMDQMKKAMPLWHNMSVAIFKDHDTNSKWGWVQEMYAFTLTLYAIGVRKVELALNLMAQPPWDSRMELSEGRPYYILHYTYGNDLDMTGKFTPGKYGRWRFDKRTYANMPPPRHLGPPPEGTTNEMIKALIASINEATANIECWDEYYQTGKVQPCKEKLPNSVYYRKFED